MKIIQNPKFALACLLPMFFLIFSACEKDEPNDQPPQVDAITQKVNNFVVNNMYDAYLWNNQLPNKSTFDIRYESDPYKLLETFIYTEFDPWTFLSDDANQIQGSIDGDGKTFGYSFAVGRISNTEGQLFGLVKFVYPDSPAEEAGLKRGDILLKINDADITEENYMQLHNGDNLTVTLGEISEEGTLKLSDKKITMSSIAMVLNPVVAGRVIEIDEHKIGYLCYTGFQLNSHEKLSTALQQFKGAGITDMVLDLRYNSGGYAITSTYLSSMLAPAAKVNGEDLFLKHIWNDRYMNYFDEEQLETRFDPTVPVNLDLPRLYVLTSASTASASESTIIGLKSHMEVIQIGTNTSGKYCGALLLRPWIDDKGALDKDIENWMLMIIVYKFANKDGFTDFRNGLTPQYQAEENLFAAIPLGDERDALLAKAISLITGKAIPATKSSTPDLQYRLLPELDPKFNRNGMIVIPNNYSN